ncbi:unnamed protein product [Peniophora sp. CBMAI 1063]|nr:unnamed protein product [Peniophora sp. CBMAI 1063]
MRTPNSAIRPPCGSQSPSNFVDLFWRLQPHGPPSQPQPQLAFDGHRPPGLRLTAACLFYIHKMQDVRDAGEPFAALDADVILRSSDNVDFRSYRIALKLASPIFETMFALPTPQRGSGGDEQKDGIAVVCMAENEKALRMLLSLCHANVEMALDTLDDIATAVQLASKFELQNARIAIRLLLREFASTDPERVYALAWAMQSRELVLRAAEKSLSSPLILPKRAETSVPEFHDISAHALRQLITFQSRCIFAASRIGEDLSWLRAGQIPARGKEKGEDIGRCSSCHDTKVQLKEPTGRETRIKNWWLDYLKRVGKLFEEDINAGGVVRNGLPILFACASDASCSGGCTTQEITSTLVLTAESVVEVRIREIVEEALQKLETPFG